MYRSDTGIYYGRTRKGGRDRVHCLDTHDRLTAENELARWLNSLRIQTGTIDPDISLDAYLTKFTDARAGMGKGSRGVETWVAGLFRDHFAPGVDIPLRRVRTSDIMALLSTCAGDPEKDDDAWRSGTYNRARLTISQIFDLAVADGVIPKDRNPFDPELIPRRKKERIVRAIPTEDELRRILSHVRAQKCNARRDATGDFLEFIARAGLGQAEARALRIRDVDFASGEMSVTRKKTKVHFQVPVYAWLRPVLETAISRLKAPQPDTLIFQIKDGKRALSNACDALGLAHFSQRNLRAMLIKRLWMAGVDIKLIAKWQGHQDGGRLVMEIYTEVFSTGDTTYQAAQLAKAAAYTPV